MKKKSPGSRPGMTRYAKNILLILGNIFLAVALVVSVIVYTNITKEQRKQTQLNSFCSIVDSMKHFSESTLQDEKNSVDNWIDYITQNHLTRDEAIEYIRVASGHSNRIAHLVDMEIEPLSAVTTYADTSTKWVHNYLEEATLNVAYSQQFIQRMWDIYNNENDELYVLGRYHAHEWQRYVIAVGARVDLRGEDGNDTGYLLLRLIPVDELQKLWSFPEVFAGSEISLITNTGGYIVQSYSMRSGSFAEFIRAYNFQDNYKQSDALIERLSTTDSGLMIYNNSKGQPCYFYYSALGVQGIDILGYIPTANFTEQVIDWGLIGIACGIIAAILLLDGLVILSVNRKLKVSAAAEKKANSAKTDFLSSMSHDIRTPMNAVRGATELAKLHVNEPEVVRDCLDKVSHSAEHLLTLINDILDISKIESGKMTLNPAPFSLKEISEEVQLLTRQLALEKDVNFSYVPGELQHDLLIGDQLRLRQILINLLNNAVKYTPPGGHVEFSVAENDADGNPDLTEVVFTVVDDGIGMTEEFQKQMYATFVRAVDGRVDSKEGSGLGLSIVRKMVDLMDGTIGCESAPGKGTTFTVTILLPFDNNATADESFDEIAAATAEVDVSGLQILVAEDNEINWEIIEAMLGEYGVNATRAENGMICLDILSDANSPRYDAIFMDVQMPVMNGRDATRRIRSSHDDYIRNIPVVAMTADAFAEDTAACFASGMDAHIAKPVDMRQILKCLQKIKTGTLRTRKEN